MKITVGRRGVGMTTDGNLRVADLADLLQATLLGLANGGTTTRLIDHLESLQSSVDQTLTAARAAGCSPLYRGWAQEQ